MVIFGPDDQILSAGLLSDNRKVVIAAYETMRLWGEGTIL